MSVCAMRSVALHRLNMMSAAQGLRRIPVDYRVSLSLEMFAEEGMGAGMEVAFAGSCVVDAES